MSDALETVRAAAAARGFDVAGVTSAEPLEEDLERLAAWCAEGHAGTMGWLSRNPPQRARPRTLLATARSVVTLAADHGWPAAPFQAEGRYGRVARYAWGRDYHDVLLPRLRALAADLSAAFGAKAKVAADQSPLLERAIAARAGTGFVGKNTCLLLPRRGSWFFLGEVLLDVALPTTDAPAPGGCGACRLCLDACPTGALVDERRLDARRCVSYLTIESADAIPRALRGAMGAWVFGCDGCQDPCPFNKTPGTAPWPEFAPEAGVGPRLDLVATLAIDTDDAYEARFWGTPLRRPGRRGLLRNAAVVARNVGAAAAVHALEALARGDREPLLRSHALWALAGLDPARARRLADRARLADGDAGVLEEADAVLQGTAA